MPDLLHIATNVLTLVIVALPFGIIGGIAIHVYDRITENRRERDRSPPESDI